VLEDLRDRALLNNTSALAIELEQRERDQLDVTTIFAHCSPIDAGASFCAVV
jgi:hypothetical protein